MDVLEFWSPNLNWAAFLQGAVSDRAWTLFRNLVSLSHAHAHWSNRVQHVRLAPPPNFVFPSETKSQRKKRHDSWKREIEHTETHMHRAAFLAAERIALLSYLITPDDEGRPDWKLYMALRMAVAHQPDHTAGRYAASAFTAFDADAELAADPSTIAAGWLQNAGLAERGV